MVSFKRLIPSLLILYPFMEKRPGGVCRGAVVETGGQSGVKYRSE
jgi:hypothetical protein